MFSFRDEILLRRSGDNTNVVQQDSSENQWEQRTEHRTAFTFWQVNFGEEKCLAGLHISDKKVEFNCKDENQIQVCSPKELDCVGGVKLVEVGDEEECKLQHCEGIIADVVRQPGSDKNEEDLAQFIADYERYKSPHSANITLPAAMKGEETLTGSDNMLVVYFQILNLKATSR